MSKKQSTDGKSDQSVAVETVIDHEIDLMLRRLRNKGVCPGCTAQGMLWRGSFLHTDFAGPEKTVEVCHDIIDAIERPDEMSEMSASSTQH